MRLVLIEWVDAARRDTGWQVFEDAPAPALLTCKSVGWLRHDGRDCKVVVPHVSVPHENCMQQGCGDMTIPASAIVRMVTIRER